MVAADFIGKTICLDTAPIIYALEGNSRYQNRILPLFTANAAGQISFISSTITLVKVLVKPLRDGDIVIAQQYREILTRSYGLQMFEITTAIAEEAAKFRAIYNFRTPDAIQLAVGIAHGADYFLTNDKGLKKAGEIKVLTLDDLN